MTLDSASGLRTGLTTGTCAAAATKAAALALKGLPHKKVTLVLPSGDTVEVPIESAQVVEPNTVAVATVRKDAGDDPDITNGMAIVVTVKRTVKKEIVYVAGEGVGTMTKPGLQIPPGEPAINPAPRRMMAAAFAAVFPNEGAELTVAVPGGAEKARNTFNPRLGISGGISILGTSGRVIPRSEEAWFRSLLPQIDMAVAQGFTTLVVTPGAFGAALRQHLPPVPDDAVIPAGNFIGDILLECKKRGATKVILAGHAGKLVKVAAGIFNTHSRFGDARLETVAALAAAAGATPQLVAQLLDANTTEDAGTLLAQEDLLCVWDAVAARAAKRASLHADLPVECALTNYHGDVLGLSPSLRDKSAKPAPCFAVVGVGPGTAGWLPPLAWRLISSADILVGGERHLQEFAHAGQRTLPLSARLGDLIPLLKDSSEERVVFLASGDPGLFGLLDFVRRTWPEHPLQVVPGLSSFQMAAARLQISWEKVHLASVHGRPLDALRAEVESHPRLFVLTDRNHTPERVAGCLVDWEVPCQLAVLENLSYTNEILTRGTPADLAGGHFNPLSVVYIERTE